MARKASPQAKKAMRLKHSKGISLKEAWRRVRSGSSRSGSKSRSSGRKKKMVKKQGLASWITSVGAWAVGLMPAFTAFRESMRSNVLGTQMRIFGSEMSKAYTGYDPLDGSFDIKRAAFGWGTMAAAVGVKKGGMFLAKKAPIRTAIPKIL